MSKHFPSGSCNSFREWCNLVACIQVLVGNNMRISHINNTSQMFTMADIDFVKYIMWCCPTVTVVQHHRGNKCFICNFILVVKAMRVPILCCISRRQQYRVCSGVLCQPYCKVVIQDLQLSSRVLNFLEVHPSHRVHLYQQCINE